MSGPALVRFAALACVAVGASGFALLVEPPAVAAGVGVGAALGAARLLREAANDPLVGRVEGDGWRLADTPPRLALAARRAGRLTACAVVGCALWAVLDAAARARVIDPYWPGFVGPARTFALLWAGVMAGEVVEVVEAFRRGGRR